jgi:arginase
MRNSTKLLSRTVSLISLPVNLGQPLLGPDKAPSLLFNHGLIPLLSSLDWRILQVPELIYPTLPTIDTPNAKNCNQVGRICEQIYHQVSEHAATSNFILILGGDHCIPIGTVPALRRHRPKTGVVWIDAHADINTPKTSNSGNMHGMPLGFLLNLVENINALPSLSWFKPPYLSPRDIVYIGLRFLLSFTYSYDVMKYKLYYITL